MLKRFFLQLPVGMRWGWIRLALAIYASMAAAAIAQEQPADRYVPQPMVANPPARYQSVGRPDGMPLFPAQPLPGHPGADRAKNRNPWCYPQRLNYPGSVENYRNYNQKYIDPINPFNHRTLVKNFLAVDMKGVTPQMKETWAPPVEFVARAGPRIYTGDKLSPVPVVRLKPNGDRLQMQLDPLPTGLYCVRLIAAIESQNVAKYPKDLILDMKINDGPQGQVSHYVLRQRGTDNFYSLGEFYFHVEDARSWDISLGLHADSAIDLLVHNVDVHDVLAETAKRAGKTQSIHLDPQTIKANWESERVKEARQNAQKSLAQQLAQLAKQYPDLSEQELIKLRRRQRDDMYWNQLPPLNFSYYNYGSATLHSVPDPKTAAELKARDLLPDDYPHYFGWSNYKAQPFWRLDRPGAYAGNAINAPWRLVWEKADGSKEYYTLEDMKALKPLPGLPFEVRPWGKRFEDEKGQAYFLFPQVQAANSGLVRVKNLLDGGKSQGAVYTAYVTDGDLETTRDLALLLVRLAYDLPTYSTIHAFNSVAATENSLFDRSNPAHQHRRRNYQYIEWENLAETYDILFPFIADNQELADAVSRYIKWVKTPRDVVALLDTYLVQYGAREALYFQYYYNHAHARMIANFAAIQNDPAIASPWVQSIFERTWEYPHPYASIENYLYLATQRDGSSTIGSYSYALDGATVVHTAPLLDIFVSKGGDTRYAISDTRRFPRVAEAPYFALEARVAGMHPPQIGDVGGPNTGYGQWFNGGSELMNLGWQWWKDPRFAWCIVNYGKRMRETDAQWKEIQAAAATISRSPFLTNRSRVLSNWGAYLETGLDSNDFRFRSAARIRVGMGEGHAHGDTLDLGFWSLGLTFSGDAGGRGGYGRPATTATLAHNLVLIDKGEYQGHAWIPELADMNSLQYLRANTARAGLYSRQVALVQVDQGKPASTPPSTTHLAPGTRYGNDAVTPRSYLVDFFRVQGGKEHAYSFHGPTEDQFQLNIPTAKPDEEQLKWLTGYVLPEEHKVGVIDQDCLSVTYRMAREPLKFTVPERGARTTRAPEASILGNAYDEQSPRKFLRVHLPGQKGQTLYSSVLVVAPYGERTDGEWLRRVHVARAKNSADKQPMSSLFAAVWEPYAGEPFIQSVKLEGDPVQATGHAALRVKTADGLDDLHFADMPGAEVRTLSDGVKVQGSYAYLSRDKQGIRQAALVGGILLEDSSLRIQPARASYQAQVKQVDYLDKKATLDQALPAKVLDGAFFEVGTLAKDKSAARWTNFQALKIEPVPQGGSTLTWRKGADCGRCEVVGVETGAALLAGSSNAYWKARGLQETDKVVELKMYTDLPDGQNTQLALVKDGIAQQVRCNSYGAQLVISGPDAELLKIQSGDRLSLYEIAPGDFWKIPTRVLLTRHQLYYNIVESNVDCIVAIKASKAQWSLNGQDWHDVIGGIQPGFINMKFTVGQFASGPIHLRWQ